jgi:signal recognition particle GTPase
MNGGEEASVPMSMALEEDQEIDISDLDELLEELIVDIDPQKGGWAATPDDIMHWKEKLKLAQLAGEKAHEDTEEIKNAAERLAEEKRTLIGKNKKLMKAFQSLKEKFEQVNLSNARLIYTNRILTNNSLNERQKSKIVESLSSADSIEEAKVIFETLQSAVGSVHQRKQPQSLREAIQRSSGTSLRRESRETEGPEVSRMQILAGIKNK